jgi:hypothetical protein
MLPLLPPWDADLVQHFEASPITPDIQHDTTHALAFHK